MNRSLVAVVGLMVPLTLAATQQAGAAISPEKVAQMKQAATDVFQIEVVDVEVSDATGARKNVMIKATIVAVDRSDDRRMPGDEIVIESYQVSTANIADRAEAVAELLDAVISPQAPPPIPRGWKGTVYLNAKDTKGNVKRYALAAFGHSFRPAENDAAKK